MESRRIKKIPSKIQKIKLDGVVHEIDISKIPTILREAEYKNENYKYKALVKIQDEFLINIHELKNHIKNKYHTLHCEFDKEFIAELEKNRLYDEYINEIGNFDNKNLQHPFINYYLILDQLLTLENRLLKIEKKLLSINRITCDHDNICKVPSDNNNIRMENKTSVSINSILDGRPVIKATADEMPQNAFEIESNFKVTANYFARSSAGLLTPTAFQFFSPSEREHDGSRVPSVPINVNPSLLFLMATSAAAISLLLLYLVYKSCANNTAREDNTQKRRFA